MTINAPLIPPESSTDMPSNSAWVGFKSSLWFQTDPTPPAYPKVPDSLDTEVAVIGAGFAGLSAALALLEQGVGVAVLEARQPGFGASGRNGGQVIPFSKHEPAALCAMYGDEIGRGIVDLTISAADRVFDLIRRHGIECDAVQTGWLQASSKPAGYAALKQRCEVWGKAGAKATWLDGDTIRQYSGSPIYQYGWLLGGGGTVHPLKYVRGLARAVSSLGGAIHGDSPALSLKPDDGRWVITTPTGVVKARRVILTTNGYTTDLWPGLRQTVVPLYSMQVATDPLPAAIGAEILPGGQSMTDALRLIHYFRRDAQGRFIIGERGPFRDIPRESDTPRVIGVARRMYPALNGVDFPFRWSGKVAMTTDHMPHFHQLAPGLSAILGFNGRGVAMATTLGQVLATACLDGKALSTQFPVTPMRPIAMHSLNLVGIAAMIAYYRLLDRIA